MKALYSVVFLEHHLERENEYRIKASSGWQHDSYLETLSCWFSFLSYVGFLEAPLKYISHFLGTYCHTYSSGRSIMKGESFKTGWASKKSASALLFMAFLDTYSMSYCWSETTHFANRPFKVGQLKMYLRDQLWKSASCSMLKIME